MMLNLSNSLTVMCSILVVITCVVVLANVGIPALTKKGVNLEKYIETADAVVDKAGALIQASDSLLPNNPIVNTIKIIEKWAKVGVDYAEQLYNTSKLDKNERNDKAKEQVYSVLKLLGVKTTPEIDKIIDGAIEAEVLALGHTPVEIKQYQEAHQQLQDQNTQLQQENTQLKETINSVQTTVQAVIKTV